VVPVAVTERVKALPSATVWDCGWAVICGAITLEPLLDEDEEELELLEDELLELEDEDELLDEELVPPELVPPEEEPDELLDEDELDDDEELELDELELLLEDRLIV